MPQPNWYVSDDEPESPRLILKAAATAVPKGIYSGSIHNDAPYCGSWYSDGERSAISSRTIAEFADYHALPKDHRLHEPESTGRGAGMTPRETDRIGMYTSARGAAFHKYVESNVSADDACKSELDTPTGGDTWREVYETVDEAEVAPELEAPGVSKDYRDALVEAATFEVIAASRILRNEWGAAESYRVGREVPFLVERDSRRWGGCVDRVSALDNDPADYPRGVFAVEMKLADEIRPVYICQAASYRWAFSEFPYVEKPMEAAVVRIDLDAEECEVLTSLDPEWPEDAMEKWVTAYDRFYAKHGMVDSWLHRSSRRW